MPHTLLVADDSVTIQRVIELTFADEDIRVVAVSNGEQAIAEMEDDPPDIVLADVGMPGRNGYEVAQYMKNTPRLAHIPVLLLTGAFEPIDRERAAAVACDGVLDKPFEPQQVIARVKELLSGPRHAVTDVGLSTGTEGASASVVERDVPHRDRAMSGQPPASVDEYFSRLDEAFAGLTGGSPTEPTARDRRSQPLVVALPSLEDAFAALLAAEQSAPESVSHAGWPAPMLVPTEALIEEVSRRVLDCLSDSVGRAAVANVVSAVAERLVREEIERIKASIDTTPED